MYLSDNGSHHMCCLRHILVDLAVSPAVNEAMITPSEALKQVALVICFMAFV